MQLGSGNFDTGATYHVTMSLRSSDDYSYYFEAQDKWQQPASGEPTIARDGPAVSSVAMPDLENLQVFPNPANEILIFEGLTERGTLLLVNVSGQKVLERDFTPDDSGKVTLDTKKWASGLYVYIVRDKINGKSITGKVVIKK